MSGQLGALALLGAAGLAAGCGAPGSVTFVIAEPAVLSPLLDPRRDSITITDEVTGTGVGSPVSAVGPGGGAVPIGNVHVGSYHLRLAIGGGGQLLGLGRTRGFTVGPRGDQPVTLHVRKPLAFYGSSQVLPTIGISGFPKPAPLLAFDSTLPGGNVDFTPQAKITDPARATASTGDGRFLLVGAKNRLWVVDTSDFGEVGSVEIPGATSVRSIVVAGDDRAAAVVVDEGVATIPDLRALLKDPGGSAPQLTRFAGARAATFHPDGRTITALSGPSWEAIVDACANPGATNLATFSVDGAPQTANQRSGPAGATDIAFDGRGHLLVAAPCNKDGVITEDGSKPPVGGPGVIDVVATGDRIAGVSGAITVQPVAVDPNDPRTTNPREARGELFVVSAGGTTKVPLPLRNQRPLLTGADDFLFLVTLTPSRLDAYDAALSPDGAHMVFLARVRYSANRLRYFEHKSAGMVDYYCELDYTEDVYTVFEVDLASGAPGYQSTKGIVDGRCNTVCNDCRLGACFKSEKGCRISDGFVPSGATVLMGAQ